MSTLDEEWIMLAKLGDHQAMTDLLTKYKHLVKNVSRKYFLIGGDQEDLMQEGMIGLYDAILSYDPEKNDHFEKYAYLLIERNILNAIKKDKAFKNSPLNDGARINHQAEIEKEEGKYSFALEEKTPEEYLLEKERGKLFEKVLQESLSPLEKNIVEEYLQGKSYQQIADALAITTKSVDNALSRIKAKLSTIKELKE